MDKKNIVLNTNLPYTLLKRGKVRDIYDLGDNLLIVSTDRISAFDVVLPDGIPYKGEALNLLSAYWFKETEQIVPNHLLKIVDSRTVLVKKTDPVKVEFVVRGYLYGSAWEKYRNGENVCGVKLPTGLQKAEKLPEPILTPTTKAEVGHDIELTRNQVEKIIGKNLFSKIEEYSLNIYEATSKKAELRGIIIADTKFEFGLLNGNLLLIDEILTPDSSRFWSKNIYRIGEDQPSFDKQYVRDYLTSIGWNRRPPAPHLPDKVIVETSCRYVEAYEKLTGEKFNNRISRKLCEMPSKYAEAGVDVKKRGIDVFQETVSNLFPGAFCVIIEDPNSPVYGLVTHVDSAGSKPVQAYLNWKETGNLGWFKGLAQDVLAMNLNDIACVGARPINFVDYIALNPFKVPKIDLLKFLNDGFKENFKTLEKLGIKILFSGGETADLPDMLRTFDISGVVNGRVEMSKAIIGAEIRPGDVIIGLRSGGKTKYEEKENSGIMCNGLTLARLCLLSKQYQRKYPEIADPEGRGYHGKFKIDTYIEEVGMTVGEALVSPMRFYSPVVFKMLNNHQEGITGLVHNMGGGQTKGLRIGKNINFIKDNIIEPDPIFHLIQKESSENWKSMFEIFNMGTGFEIVARPEVENGIIDISESFGLEAKTIGRCEKSSGKNKVTIICSWGRFQYQRE